MKGCLIITKKKSRIAARVILIVLILAFLALAAAVLISPVRYRNEDQQNNFTFPEIVGNGSDGFVAHNKASATIPATDGIELTSGTVEQSLCGNASLVKTHSSKLAFLEQNNTKPCSTRLLSSHITCRTSSDNCQVVHNNMF